MATKTRYIVYYKERYSSGKSAIQTVEAILANFMLRVATKEIGKTADWMIRAVKAAEKVVPVRLWVFREPRHLRRGHSQYKLMSCSVQTRDQGRRAKEQRQLVGQMDEVTRRQRPVRTPAPTLPTLQEVINNERTTRNARLGLRRPGEELPPLEPPRQRGYMNPEGN